MSSEPNTPGLGGYLLGILVSDLACAFIVVTLAAAAGAPQMILAFPIVLVYASVCAIPVGVVGAVLLHLTCHHVRSQGVHILVAGLLGAALVLIAIGGLFHEEIDVLGLSFAALAAVSGAIGRMALVPMVERRRLAFGPVDSELAPYGPLRIP